ncbi:MAG: sulfatase-like hydrolase/transferase [Pirellulaceae bacterium]
MFDETCGQLLDHIDERGLADDTIVVYVTDNGWIQRTPETESPEGWRYGFAPRSKQSPNESGVRTPIMIRWPGHVEPRRDEEHLASSIDLVPTLLAAIGRRAAGRFAGVDLLAEGSAEQPPQWQVRDTLFGESYVHDVTLDDELTGLLCRWCIEGRWKLIVSHSADVSRFVPLHGSRETRLQLYDLMADPHETTNLAANHPEIVARMRALIDQWWSVDHPPVVEELPPRVETENESRAEVDRTRPNVVLIMSDDQGYGDVGFHGNTMIRTPRLNDLAQQSFRLTNFHVDPTCSETRSALMTGRYSCRVGVWHTIQGRSLLDPRYPTMANWFSDAGYTTGIFGKWHLGDAYPLRPQDRGFQRSLVHGGGGIGQTPDFWGNEYFDPVLCDDGHWHEFEGYCTEIFVNGAIEFIEEAGDKPFFCYIPTNVPHGPYQIHPERAAEVAERGVPRPMNQFYAMIEHFDSQVGRVLDCLEERGLADNTIVIYMTDNGTAAGVAGNNVDTDWRGFNALMRGQKGSQFDGGHRVPCFVRWPAGGVQPGESARLAAHFDLLPTLAEWCELGPPELGATMPGLDGRSLAPLITGNGDWEERTLVVHSQRQEMPQRWHKTAVMTDRWRLVDGRQLFDITVDPGQQNDLAGENAAVVERLTQSYDQWWDSVSRDFDRPVRMIVGAEASGVTSLTGHDWHGPSVPWHQGHIREDAEARGVWQLSAATSGLYRITLRMRPAVQEYEFGAGKATLTIGDRQVEQSIEKGSAMVVLEVPLSEGDFSFEALVEEEGHPPRGAYFVDFERL